MKSSVTIEKSDAPKLETPRRWFEVIVNPISGWRDRMPVVAEIRRLLRHSGGYATIHQTTGPGSASEIAAKLSPETEAVLIVGGDGTIGDVINGLGGSRVPLLILRTGTENLLAKELRHPKAPASVVTALMHGDVVAADVGSMNGRRFASVMGVGFDAECVSRLSRVRRGHIGYWSYLRPIFETFWHHSFPELQIETDGVELFRGRGMAFIGVISRYGAGLRILKEARNDDGLLDVVVMPCASRRRTVAHAGRVLLRRHVNRGGIRYVRCRNARITSPDQVPVELDGDCAGHLPADVTVLPGAVRFISTRGKQSNR